MKKTAIGLSLISALFMYQIAVAQVGSPARSGQPVAGAGVRSAIEADAEATKIEFRTEDGRPIDNVLTDQRGYIVATVSNKGGIQLTGLKTQIEVDGTIVRQDDLTIGVGRSQDITMSYAFTTPGNHIIALTIDPRNQINESNENNNRTEKVITVAARAYDVEATSIECNPTGGSRRNVNVIDKGGEADLVGTVTNKGNASITRVKIRLMVGGSIVREDTVAIEPGRTTSLTGRYKFDNAGPQIIIFVVDPDNVIQETNKNNNRTQKTIEVQVKPLALITDIRLEPQKIRVIPVSPLPDYGALGMELIHATEAIIDAASGYGYVTRTYINSIQFCLSNNYTVQDQRAAGCTGTDTVDACMPKLYTWCCNTNMYRHGFEDRQRRAEEAAANLPAKLQAFINAIGRVKTLLTP
ncbi:MAG: hypothetical protein D4R93_01845 [Deltaproteobacteria bacterium]|nr:MAG: hypothetical protein D4R93_01845 [Deltaproteobacteria bacterium]